MENGIPSKCAQEKTGSAVLVSDTISLKSELVRKKNNDGYFLLMGEIIY